MKNKNCNVNLFPENFIKNLNLIFTPSEVDKILTAFKTKRKTTFRLNSLKTDRITLIELLKKKNIKFNTVTFIKDAFYLEDDDKKLLNSDIYKNGLIYIQSLSSMLPALVLDPKKGEKILDLAAAPGSKTTQIAAMMGNYGLIDAVEPNYIRMERLKYNCKLQGASIVNFFQIEGEKFQKEENEFYDKVLIDAPCSGEGTICLLEKTAFKELEKQEKYANLQYKLLKKALSLVKKDGIVVYSTCTLNHLENESVINRLLSEKEISFTIEPCSNLLHIGIEELKNGFTSIKGNNLSSELKKSIRILPSQKMEGFFICKIKKK